MIQLEDQAITSNAIYWCVYDAGRSPVSFRAVSEGGVGTDKSA